MRRDRHAHPPVARRPATAGFLVAVLAASLVPGTGAATAQDHVDLTLEPAIERHTAVRNGQQVGVSGTAPAGDFTAATLIGTTSSGHELEQAISDSVLNREPPGFGEEDRDHLHNDEGEVVGELTLGPVFRNDDDPVHDVRWAELEVTIEDEVTGLTDRVAIDTVNPFIRGYELIDDREIRVVFSEPVQNPTLTDPEVEDGLDLSVDWSVEGSEVLAVADGEEGDCLPRRTNELDRGEDADEHHAGDTGCTRRLTLASALDGDATPYVEYAFESRILRESYDDYAGNLLRQAQGDPFSDARDLIRPAEPEILAVDAAAPDDGVVIGGDPTPSVTVANLRDPDEGPAGPHTVRFLVDPADEEPFETDPVTAEGEEMTLDLPDLGDVSRVDVTAVAVDPHGNRSDEEAKNAVRDDADPSTVTYFLGVPDLAFPQVEQPEDELFTDDDEVLVAGGFGDATGPEIGDIVEVLDGSDVIADGPVDGDDRWEAATPLDADGRFDFEVRALDEATGAVSDAVGAPDVVRDTRAPQVDVAYPDEKPLTDSPTARRRTYFVGDRVEVRYEAEDQAEGDDELPDHGDHVGVTLVSDVGERTVDDDAPYDPGQEVSTSTVIEPDDLDGRGQVEALFDVAVTDLAGNVGEDSSADVLLSDALIGYAADYVAATDDSDPARIVLEFPVELDVPVLRVDPAHWQVDGEGVESATYDEADGATRVTLEVDGIEDPNARPEVEFVADELDPTRPRGSDGREISSSVRPATDRIPPALRVSRVLDEHVRDVPAVTLSGRTDETQRPNRIEVFHLDADGVPNPGDPVATADASRSGAFSVEVPLLADQRNRLAFEAVDPSGNRSDTVSRELIHVTTPETAPITCPEGRVEAPPYGDRSAIPTAHLANVDCASFRGIVEGFGDGSFRPREPVYRDQMASFVARMIDTAAGAQSLPDPDVSDDEFGDIEGSAHRDNIRRLYAAGIIEGRTRTHYAPRMEVRRDQVATFVVRAAAYARGEHVAEGESGERAFPDVGPDNVHFERVNDAAGVGLVEGHTDGTYRPANSTERAQMASLVVRGLTHGEE